MKQSLRVIKVSIPSGVQAVVSEWNLGSIIHRYSIEKIGSFFLGFFMLLFWGVGPLALIPAVIITSPPTDANGWAIALGLYVLLFMPIGLLVSLASLRLLAAAFSLQGKHLYQCSKGVVLAGRKQTEVFLYEEMALRFRAVAVYRYGAHMKDKYNITIGRRGDKKKILLDESNLGNGVTGLSLFKAELAREIIQVQLPRIQATLQAGETVWFELPLGAMMGINNYEIIHKRGEKEKRKAWHELSSAIEQKGFLKLYAGRHNWLALGIGSITNYDLFKLLIDQKLSEYGSISVQ
ncbi:DUF6585 family protein [Ktedonospora formicarum]|uniref:Uncharacterized protein n=1 Tax=Ktedonospora formicarum TaxID=2778364 RepID=A0A8J3HZJ9_9CHLR|nr:DUF6585 family protein [Ktedonospora formicarum]GHO42159.1 hypothetical protein KSX_03220 [Ktedonospora formicarum]